MAQTPAATPVSPGAVVAPPATDTSVTPTPAKPSLWNTLGNQVLAHDTMTAEDANGDGIISHDEFLAYEETQFKAMDKNGDGQLSADEIAANRKGGIPGL